MDTRAIATELRMSSWVQAMQERVAAGISVKEFCHNRCISQNTYYYWQRKLRAAACEKLLPAAEGGVKQSLVPSGWAMCKASEAAPAKSLTIEIGGYRIMAEPDTDPELLAKTCRMLKSLC